MVRLALLWFLTLALVVVGSPPLHAQTAADQEARALYQQGASLYDEGRYDEAVTVWTRAYDLSPRPLLLFNIANALERLGRMSEALDYLARYRPTAPDGERDKVDARIENLERRVAEQRRRDEDQRQAEVQRLRTEQARRDEDQRAMEAREEAAGKALAEAQATKSVQAARPHPGPILVFAVGAGAGGIGAVFEGLALSARQEAGNLCSADPIFCPQSAASAITRDKTNSAIGDALVIGGGATAGAGLILWIVDAALRAEGKAPATVHVLPAGSTQSVGILVAGSFPR